MENKIQILKKLVNDKVVFLILEAKMVYINR